MRNVKMNNNNKMNSKTMKLQRTMNKIMRKIMNDIDMKI